MVINLLRCVWKFSSFVTKFYIPAFAISRYQRRINVLKKTSDENITGKVYVREFSTVNSFDLR